MTYTDSTKLYNFLDDTMFKHGYTYNRESHSSGWRMYKKDDVEVKFDLSIPAALGDYSEKTKIAFKFNYDLFRVEAKLQSENDIYLLLNNMIKLAVNIASKGFHAKKVSIDICEEMEQEFNLNVEGKSVLYRELMKDIDGQLLLMTEKISYCTDYLWKTNTDAEQRVRFKRHMDYVRISAIWLLPVKSYMSDSQKIQLETYENIANSINMKYYVY